MVVQEQNLFKFFLYMEAEIVHTIVDSFGLVTVAPLTVIMSGFLLTRGEEGIKCKSERMERC